MANKSVSKYVARNAGINPAAKPWASEIESRLVAVEKRAQSLSEGGAKISGALSAWTPLIGQIDGLSLKVNDAASLGASANANALDAVTWSTVRPVSPAEDGSVAAPDVPVNQDATWFVYVQVKNERQVKEVWRWKPPTGDEGDKVGEWVQQKFGTDTLGKEAVDLSNLSASLSSNITEATRAVDSLRQRVNEYGTAYERDKQDYDNRLRDVAAKAGTKGRVIVSATEPQGADRNEGNLWINTANGGSQPYAFDRASGTWKKVESSAAKDAAAKAVEADRKADRALRDLQSAQDKATAAGLAAQKAQKSADGKNQIFYTRDKPTLSGRVDGDLWFDADDEYKMYRYDASRKDFVVVDFKAEPNLSHRQYINGLYRTVNRAEQDIDLLKGSATDAAQKLNILLPAHHDLSDRVDDNKADADSRLQRAEAALTAQEASIKAAKADLSRAQAAANAADGKAVKAQQKADLVETKAASMQRSLDTVKGTMTTLGRNVRVSKNRPGASDGANTPTGGLWFVEKPGTLGETWKWDGKAWHQLKAGADFMQNGVFTAVHAANGFLGSMTAAHGVLNSANIGVLTAANIRAGSIDSSKLNVADIQAKVVATTNLHADRITAGTFGGERIRANSITSSKLVVGEVQSAVVRTASLDAGKITSGVLSADRIAANSITAAKLNVGDIQSKVVRTTNIDASKITSGIISAARINTDTLRGKILEGGVVKSGNAQNGIQLDSVLQVRQNGILTNRISPANGIEAVNPANKQLTSISDMLFGNKINIWTGDWRVPVAQNNGWLSEWSQKVLIRFVATTSKLAIINNYQGDGKHAYSQGATYHPYGGLVVREVGTSNDFIVGNYADGSELPSTTTQQQAFDVRPYHPWQIDMGFTDRLVKGGTYELILKLRTGNLNWNHNGTTQYRPHHTYKVVRISTITWAL